MKFWQLLDIFRDEQEILAEIFKREEWEVYYNHYYNIEAIVQEQRREILDAEINNEFLKEVCAKSIKVIYLSPSESKIYSYRNKATPIEIPIANAITLFTHDSIEEVFEKSESNVIM